MTKIIVLLLIFFQLSSLNAQEDKITAQEINSIGVAIDFLVGFDGMGNYYYIKNNVFYKKNERELWQYKNVSLGKITRVDIQNHLKIMLFYEDFNTVILLDNQLNETQKINFSIDETPIVTTAVGNASQNRLWIYNSLSQQIGLYDYLKNSFQSITPSFSGNLKHYDCDFNTFQWIDDKMNWFSVDVFGKITTIGIAPDFEQMQIQTDQEIIFSQGENLFFKNLKKNRIYSIVNVDKSFKKFYYKDQILAIFTSSGITNYKITIP